MVYLRSTAGQLRGWNDDERWRPRRPSPWLAELARLAARVARCAKLADALLALRNAADWPRHAHPAADDLSDNPPESRARRVRESRKFTSACRSNGSFAAGSTGDVARNSHLLIQSCLHASFFFSWEIPYAEYLSCPTS